MSVTANVSATTTAEDVPIRLTITVTGARNANLPSRIDADGLEINLQGKSQRFELSSGFGAAMSTVITYIVTPVKIGKFTIPAVEIESGGQSLTTNPIEITVEKSSGTARDRDDDPASNNPKMYAELLIPKDTAYVGEIIPVEVRFYFDSTITFQLNPPGQVPQIDGEGFTKLRFPQARLEQKSIKGKDYRVLAYQTSLVAAKSGDLLVGPASLTFVVGIPQQRRQRSPFDDPFNNDPFANFFGNQRTEREMTLNSDPKTLKIKALPSPRPAGFNGAVGQFTMESSASPASLKIGEPVTYKAIVSGRGNFDLVSAPTLSSTDGWRTYPATGKFVQNDEMGVSGEKTFEMAMIPEKKSATVPPTSLIFFDPASEKYITLTGDPIPVQIEGQAIATPTPNPQIAGPVTPGITPPPTPAEPDLLPLKTTLRGEIASFTPIWETKTFWVLQRIPLFLLGALVWPRISAALAPSRAKAQRIALLNERASIFAATRSSDSSVFFAAAARQLEIDAKLAGRPHGHPHEIIAALDFVDDEAETVREIFRRRDEFAYGGGHASRELSAESLRRFQGVLRPPPITK